MSITIMCKPRNEAERKMLIDAGIITPAQKHSWVFLEDIFYRKFVNGHIETTRYWNVFTHHSYRVRSLRINVKQFIALFNFISLAPEADITHIVPYIETTSRNRAILEHYYLAGDLISEQYK